jgi:cyclic pyranopterin phosphate synthase
MSKLTHFDDQGRSKMVDITDKDITNREAVASCYVIVNPDTFSLIVNKEIEKGDVFEVARIAGIMGGKKTGELIPMCHPLNITSIDIKFYPVNEESKIKVESTVKIVGRTGVEMEALISATIAALTIYDMCKGVDKGITITDIKLISKKGGKSGDFFRES